MFVVVDADIECTACPHHAVDGANLCGHRLHVVSGDLLARSRGRQAIQAAKLIADEQTPLVVDAEVDPRALRLGRHGVEELNPKAVGSRDAVDRRRRVANRGGHRFDRRFPCFRVETLKRDVLKLHGHRRAGVKL